MVEMEIVKEQKIQITPKLLAEMFWKMDSTDQALYFNELSLITEEEYFESQLCSVNTCGHLSDNGRKIMSIIGDFSIRA